MPNFRTPIGANHLLAEEQPEYETISVRKQLVPLGPDHPQMVPALVASVQFTPEELRELIRNSGVISLTILGGGWPPCSINVGDPNLIYASHGEG